MVASRLGNFGLQESEAVHLAIRKKPGEVNVATGPLVTVRRAELPVGITSDATMLGEPVKKLVSHSVGNPESSVTDMESRAHVLMPNAGAQ